MSLLIDFLELEDNCKCNIDCNCRILQLLSEYTVNEYYKKQFKIWKHKLPDGIQINNKKLIYNSGHNSGEFDLVDSYETFLKVKRLIGSPEYSIPLEWSDIQSMKLKETLIELYSVENKMPTEHIKGLIKKCPPKLLHTESGIKLQIIR